MNWVPFAVAGAVGVVAWFGIRSRTEGHRTARERALGERGLIVPFTLELGQHGRFLWLGSGIEQLTRHPPKAFVQDPGLFSLGTHPEDRDQLTSFFQERPHEGEPPIEFRLRGADRDWHWVAAYRANPSGIGRTCHGYLVDVTAQHRAEEAAAQMFGESRAFLETSHEGMLTADADGRIQFLNSAAARIFGYDPEAMHRMSLAELIPEQDRRRFSRAFDTYRRSRMLSLEGQRLEIEGLHADGSHVPVEITLSTFEVEGRMTCAAVIRDLRERRIVERKSLRFTQQQAALAGLSSRALGEIPLKQLYDAALDAVCSGLQLERAWILRLDAHDRNFLRVASIGWNESDMDDLDFNSASCEWSRAALEQGCAIVAHEQAGASPFTLQPEWVARGIRTVLCAPLVEDGKAVGVVAAHATDAEAFSDDDLRFLESIANALGAVLARKRVEADLLRAHRLEAAGRMAGGVAHEFNNLLTGIIAHSEVLSDRLQTDPSLAEEVEHIQALAHRAGEVAHQLLNLGRLEPLEAEPIDLGEIVAGIHLLLDRLLGEDIDMHLKPAERSEPILGDRAHLEQVLLNLAVFARAEMPSGGKVFLGAEQPTPDQIATWLDDGDAVSGEYGCLVFKHEGRRWSQESLSALWQSQDESVASLRAAERILRDHRGRLLVDAPPEGGLLFRLLLPRVEPGAAVPTDKGPPQGVGRNVLVAEDDWVVRAAIHRSLAEWGFLVTAVSNGEEACERVEREPQRFDLILLDLVMPRVDGLRAFERIRALRPDQKFLLMTGHAAETERGTFLRSSGQPILRKPFGRVELARCLHRLIDETESSSD